MNQEKHPFKILSIDGGGIKGLYSSTILEHLEEKYECHISDYFDMICGTSTGGLIALALSLKIPAKEISRIYKENGRAIFPKRVWPVNKLRQTLFFGKYSDTNLKRILFELFGEKTLAESNNLLCIPSYSITDARPWVFKFDHAEGELERDNKALYVDIALATSAAPTYFPVSEISYYDNKQFIDGGVWANNPTLVGVIEALRYFVKPPQTIFNEIQVLSISSLNNTGGKPTGRRRKRSFWGWREDLFETSLIGSSFFTDYIMSQLHNSQNIDIKYVRVPSENISAEQQQLVKLDNSSKKALNLISGKGNDRGVIANKDTSIREFFIEQKKYSIKEK